MHRVATDPLRLLLALSFFLCLALSAHANTSTTVASWTPAIENAYALDITYNQCPLTLGNHTITATVTGVAFGASILDANVFATITKPDAS